VEGMVYNQDEKASINDVVVNSCLQQSACSSLYDCRRIKTSCLKLGTNFRTILYRPMSSLGNAWFKIYKMLSVLSLGPIFLYKNNIQK